MEDNDFLMDSPNLLVIRCIEYLTEFKLLNKIIWSISLILNIDLILSISHRSKSNGVFKWSEIVTLWHCLDKVIYHIR